MSPGSLVLLTLSCLYMAIFPHLTYAATDCLRPSQQLRDWEQLISARTIFRLGFFSPTLSGPTDPGSYRYLAIWYERVPYNPVWLAKRQIPVPDSSVVVTMGSDGKLKIIYGKGKDIVMNSDQRLGTSMSNVTATLLDSGNLVLQEEYTNGTFGSVLWQSFDYPTHNLLPEMKLGMNIRTGHNWTLSSWSSEVVPDPGAFKLGVDPGGANQLVVWRRDSVYWTSRLWKNGSFEKAPELTEKSYEFEFKFVTNGNERYFSYFVKNRSIVATRWELQLWGEIMQFALIQNNNSSTWRFETVGPCHNSVENGSAVCLKQKPSECRNGSELFVPTRGFIDVINYSWSTEYNSSFTLSDCHAICWNNCSCLAYSSSSLGIGCQFWDRGSNFTSDANSKEIYLLTLKNNTKVLERIPNEESRKKNSFRSKQKHWWIWSFVAAELVIATLLLGFFCYLRRRNLKCMEKAGKRKTNQDKFMFLLRSKITPSSERSNTEKFEFGKNKGQQLQLYSLPQIATAMNNFSIDNKLGQGGFGPVYKV